jgi:putative phosphoribosyl transferase
MIFTDRVEAGRALAARLNHLRGSRPVVLGLPRGGVPVAAEVAEALGAPLDVIVVRKLGVPGQSELAMGAIGEGGVRVLEPDVLSSVGVGADEIAAVELRERAELDRRLDRFRAGRPPVALAGRTVILVDDGVATGSTARAACAVARACGAARVVLAVPVASPRAVTLLGKVADEVVAVQTPYWFGAIGEFYRDFRQTTDAEVVRALRAARHGGGTADTEVEVVAGRMLLPGRLTVPPAASGVVVFAHGSGSSRHSPRNRRVALTLAEAGLATLLLDLLSPGEERDRRNVFDVDLLGARLVRVLDWLRSQPVCAGLPVGLFGASTGAAAALWAAAEPGAGVAAVVSRGGRPDLAGDRLARVDAPTLLIVGGLDKPVIGLNELAQTELNCPNELVVVPGASHLFEEPGTLDEVAALARDWFVDQFAARSATG